MSSILGKNIMVSIFGQSHSAAIGVVMDNLPAGHAIDLDAVRSFMARRAPGKSKLATARSEADEFEVLSGLIDGYLCGAPLAFQIRNSGARPGDYAALRDTPRPGHADYTAQVKYGGFQDATGGGHFSGRMTAPLCLAGAVVMQLLNEAGIFIAAHAARIGAAEDSRFNPVNPEIEKVSGLIPTLSASAGEAMEKEILAAKEAGDSVGGIVECAAVGLPAGLGAPMFDGMENHISRALFAVPAVKGVEFGAGFSLAEARGSAANDPYFMKDGRVSSPTNNAGGILGGITNGMPLIFRAAIKPTPSIAAVQQSVSLSRGENAEIRVGGRHDPCIVPRAVPCVEAAAALAIYDMYLDRKKEL